MTATAEHTVSQEFTLERLHDLWALNHPNVFWRHDVDYSLEAALEMAMHEAQHGIRSVYYLRALATEYRPESAICREVAQEIRCCGHELGIHVDLQLPRDASVTTEHMVDACRNQAALLAHLRIYALVSFHAPPPNALWRIVPGFVHAMGPEWKGRHIADSRGVWHADPEQLLADGNTCQISTHAEWYFMPETARSALREREAVAP